jgi:phosphopantothenoylcysteine decarboxylase/phosphopantothenate--cysteine ligase
MNVRMWDHPATQRNLAQLRADGVWFVGPDEGEMACGEFGPGRLAEPEAIFASISAALAPGPLQGRHVLVTSGPTHEPIDPVRFIANRSSGAQGTAIAVALRDLGAKVTFVTGPATVPPPEGVAVVRVETAAQMLAAVQAALPADAAVFAAAVADWRVANASGQKMKKDGSGQAPALQFAENPDILATVSHAVGRPALVVGFAAETEDVVAHAMAKRLRKGCDWIVANDVSPATGIMGGTENAVTLITDAGAEVWPRMAKDEVARRLAARMAEVLAHG